MPTPPRQRGPQCPRTIDLIDAAWRARGFSSSAQFAARCPTIGESRLSNWRRGQGEPSVPQCREVAQVLGISLAELLGEVPGEIEPDWRVGFYEVKGEMDALVQKLIALGTALEQAERERQKPPVAKPAIDEPPAVTPTRPRVKGGH